MFPQNFPEQLVLGEQHLVKGTDKLCGMTLEVDLIMLLFTHIKEIWCLTTFDVSQAHFLMSIYLQGNKSCQK